LDILTPVYFVTGYNLSGEIPVREHTSNILVTNKMHSTNTIYLLSTGSLNLVGLLAI